MATFYTSYFGGLRRLPNDIVPIAICARCPVSYQGLHYKNLCPPYDVFMNYKQGGTWEDYTAGYNNKLNSMNFEKVVSDLEKLSGGAEKIALLCYEKPGDYCHRHLVAEWFREHNIPCQEYGEERRTPEKEHSMNYEDREDR